MASTEKGVPAEPGPNGLKTDELRAVQSLIQQGLFERALVTIQPLIGSEQPDIELLYCQAVCHRKLGNHREALRVLDAILARSPDHARSYQERAYNHLTKSEITEAGRAFEAALERNPALISSWQSLANLPGYPGAAQARENVRRLKEMPPALLSATSLMHQNKLHKAETLCRQFARQSPSHPEAMRLLAELAQKFQALDEAEFLLESCLEFHPDYAPARHEYVKVLHRRQKFDLALVEAQSLVQSDPQNVAYRIGLGNALLATGDFDAAITAYREILKVQPSLTSVRVAVGHALKTIGRTPQAIEAYRSSFGGRSGYGDAFWSLANLKTYRFTDDEVNDMRTLESDPATGLSDRIALCFALGKAHEDRGDDETSFEFYRRGNGLKRADSAFSMDRIAAELDHQQTHFDDAFFVERAGWGAAAPDPIFIVGLPRAGSTLLEQILASHSMVEGTMELGAMIGIAQKFNARQKASATPNYPRALADLNAHEARELGEHYLAEAARHRTDKPYFIDKMPNNFRHIALIQLILPNARIIDARRHPLACTFSCYKQLFAEGQEFSYSLEDCGDYYRRYHQIMAHWDAALPDRVLRVQHEDVLVDLKAQVERLLQYCGLPFEEACLDFHRTKRAVKTPSSEQVRQPITEAGTKVWKRFEPHLDPLKDALGQEILSEYGVN
mgnify:CR=1 FL=1